MATEFDPSAPYFLDASGAEAHIGDVVTYVTRNSKGGETSKCGTVEHIVFKGDPVSAIVKVKGSSRIMQGDTLLLVDDSTLDGAILLYTAKTCGRVVDELIEELKTAIDAFYSQPDDDSEG